MIRERLDRHFNGNGEVRKTRLREAAIVAVIPSAVAILAVGAATWRAQGVMEETVKRLTQANATAIVEHKRTHVRELSAIERRLGMQDESIEQIDGRVRDVEKDVTTLKAWAATPEGWQDWYREERQNHP